MPVPATPSRSTSSTAAPRSTNAAVLGPGCLNLRPLPRTGADAAPLACLHEGTPLFATADTATDDQGRTWTYAYAGALSGWLAAGFVQPLG